MSDIDSEYSMKRDCCIARKSILLFRKNDQRTINDDFLLIRLFFQNDHQKMKFLTIRKNDIIEH